MTQSTRHNLGDWLALHQLDVATCEAALDAMGQPLEGEPAPPAGVSSACQVLDLEGAWLCTAAAMRSFLPAQQGIIDETIANTVRIAVEPRGASRKAVTLDNGAAAYPTIVLSYRGDGADLLVVAHEFGHALQIRASKGRFVPPVMREVCAFLGEGALLSHLREADVAQHRALAALWHHHNRKYLETQKQRLRNDLQNPGTPYRYLWNYPLARQLAIHTLAGADQAWVWSIFEGKVTVREALGRLFSPPACATAGAAPTGA